MVANLWEARTVVLSLRESGWLPGVRVAMSLRPNLFSLVNTKRVRERILIAVIWAREFLVKGLLLC